MPELFIHLLARRDIKAFWAYTARQWGAAQADQYLYDLEREMQELLRFPELGTSCDHLRAGYRRLQVKRHLVFYRRHGQRLEIIRVLHDAMDVRNHFCKSFRFASTVEPPRARKRRPAMSEPETKPQAASEPTTATLETTPAAEVASLSKTVNRAHASLILMADVVNKQGIFLQAMPGQLKRLDQIDKRLFHIEDLSTPRFEGDLSIVGAYQAMAHEIADIKNAVIDLQKRQKHLEGDTSPDRPVSRTALEQRFNPAPAGGHGADPRRHRSGRLCPTSTKPRRAKTAETRGLRPVRRRPPGLTLILTKASAKLNSDSACINDSPLPPNLAKVLATSY